MCVVKTEKKPRKSVHTHDGITELSRTYSYSIEQTIIHGPTPPETENPSYQVIRIEVESDPSIEINQEVKAEIEGAIVNYHRKNGIGAEA